MTKLSIIIKTLNEEANIQRAVESAIVASAPFGGEVIVADSKSDDRTVEIASRYPVRVVQIASARARCCGIGPQLGFQHSSGDYVLIMDGDMVLDPAFVAKAAAMLDATPKLAGVGGFIREMREANLQFKGRARRLAESRLTSARDTKALTGGGLYRRSALESVGYMSDRNLHAYEEFDLGVRLLEGGWRLVELPDHAADHYSYALGTAALLLLRLRSGSMLGQGEMLRAAFASGYAPVALRVNAVRISLGLVAIWCGLAAALALGVPKLLLGAVTLGGLGGILVLLTARHRSFASALHSVVVWHLSVGGLVAGLFRRRTEPREWIDSVMLHEPAANRALARAAG
jgi:glycosyltransferase involved in cell wall biosynthesis